MRSEPVPEIRFYSLLGTSLESVLPRLLQKALEKGMRAVVKCSSVERVEALNQLLWTYDSASFIPHGSAADGNPSEQPIWLTTADENPNNADVIFLVDDATADCGAYKLCCELINERDDEALAAAHIRWKDYKQLGYKTTYWKTSPKGWAEGEFERPSAGG